MSNIFLEEISCKAKDIVVIKSAAAPLEDIEFLYLANPNGLIYYKKGSTLKTFIDLTKLVAPGGFHGMEFHPSFSENGLFYLHYSMRDSGKRTPEVNELTASNRLRVNGMNGTTLNGMNGTTLSGATINEATLNGTTMNGMNGTTLNGTTMNGMNGTTLNGERIDPSTMNEEWADQRVNQTTMNGNRVNTMNGQLNTMNQRTNERVNQTTMNGQLNTMNQRVNGQTVATQNGMLNGRMDQTKVNGANRPVTSHWNGSTYHHVDVLEEWIYIKDDSGDYATKVSTLLKIKIPFEDKTYDTLSLSPKYKKLMIALPDGGNGDPHNLAQNSKMLYGKLLAVNVDSDWCNCTETQPPIMSICDIPAGCRRDNFTLIGKGLCTPFSYDESDCGWILDNNPTLSEINVFKGDIPVNFGWKVFTGKLPVLVNDRVKYPEEIYRVDNHEPIVVSKERLVGGVTYYGEIDELYESYVVLKERTGLYILTEDRLEKVQLCTLPKGFTHFTSLGSDNDREYLIVGTNVGTFEVKAKIGSRSDEDGFKYTD